ncbi:MAG TPA: tetratricopeptide repeat protein, partial [Thermoanaerobaculia bacterium]|nr:tetratricopeptide repeat protein [Thermoanaerobaculia bacterium]
YEPSRSKKRDPSDPIQLFQEYAVTAQGYTAIAKKLLSERRDDLFMMYYEQVDSFSHLFMRYAPPKLPWVDEADYEKYKDMVSNWYEYQDQLLGQLLSKIDLDKTAVLIVSDHGFKSGSRRIHTVGTIDISRAALQHEKYGIFLAAGPHIRHGVEIKDATVFDDTPTILYYLGFPVAKDMAGKPLTEIFDPAWVKAHPVRTIPTYESKKKPNEKKHKTETYSKEQAAENMAALKALGYVNEGSEKPPAPKGTSTSESATGAGGAAPESGSSPSGKEESSPEIHNNLGRLYLQKGKVDDAKKEFEKALELDPNNSDAMLNLASTYNVKGQTADAEQLIKRALQVNPNSVPALSALAELKRDEGKLDESIRLFKEALAIDNSQPSTYIGYGDVLQRAHRFKEAEKAFHDALGLNPDSFKAYYDLGVTLSNQGHLDEAIKQYRKALKINPHDPEAAKALNNLGAIALSRGDTDQAAGYFQKAVKESRINLESRFNLALIDLDRNKVDEAIKLLKEAANIDPNKEQVAVTLGMAYLRKGQNQDAYRSLLLVERLYPDNWVARLGLAALYASVHRDKEAKKELDTALQLGGKAAYAQASGYRPLVPLLKARTRHGSGKSGTKR